MHTTVAWPSSAPSKLDAFVSYHLASTQLQIAPVFYMISYAIPTKLYTQWLCLLLEAGLCT